LPKNLLRNRPPRTADDFNAARINLPSTHPSCSSCAMSTSESGVGLDLCEAEQSALAREYVLKSELYVDEPWSHAGPRSVSPFAPCAASRLPHIFAAARLSRDSVLWDLGCGDGRVLHEAAARYGCRCVGVEIDAPCLDRCRARADAMGPDVASVCSWHLADMTAMPPGSLGADDSLAPDVPAPSVLLLFITGHGLVALSPWLKREWLTAPKPFAVVTCVEALDACIDYELGVFGQEENPNAWEVYRDPTHAKYGVFVTPPRDVALAEWAATRPIPRGCAPSDVDALPPAVARRVLDDDDVPELRALVRRLAPDADDPEVTVSNPAGDEDGDDAPANADANDDATDDDETLACALAATMLGGDAVEREADWSATEDAFHADASHRVVHLHAGDAISVHAPRLRAKLLRAAFDADAGRVESGGGWGLADGRALNVRSAEYHSYRRGGGVTAGDHRDAGSVITMSVLLEAPPTDQGGAFVTWRDGEEGEEGEGDGDDGDAGGRESELGGGDRDRDRTRDRNRNRNRRVARSTTHDDLAPGDAVVFPSEKRHGVTTIAARGGRRRSIVLELWEGGVTTHNRQR
jgi:hypothetical protein